MKATKRRAAEGYPYDAGGRGYGHRVLMPLDPAAALDEAMARLARTVGRMRARAALAAWRARGMAVAVAAGARHADGLPLLALAPAALVTAEDLADARRLREHLLALLDGGVTP